LKVSSKDLIAPKIIFYLWKRRKCD